VATRVVSRASLTPSVIPAQAGIHPSAHLLAGGYAAQWIPAFAGMTERGRTMDGEADGTG
jgi:hypothetical protein